jgi:hypothetical protein
MFTSVAFMALWGALAPQISRLTLTPQTDYREAKAMALLEKKPLAVFVGKGENAWKAVIKDGPDAEARTLLTQRFVLVYIDQATEYGQTMAASLNLTGQSGMVISGRGGEYMAYRHEGTISAADLTHMLSLYGAADHVVKTTETNVAPRAPAYVAPAAYSNPYASPYACQT